MSKVRGKTKWRTSSDGKWLWHVEVHPEGYWVFHSKAQRLKERPPIQFYTASLSD